MKRTLSVLGVLGAGGILALALGASSANQPGAQSTNWIVRITNITPGQILSPPLVATHSERAFVFTPGRPASPELAILAEDGDPAPLAAALSAHPAVADVAVGPGMLMPGAAMDIPITTVAGADRVSLATMLVTTNDTFAALHSFPLPKGAFGETYGRAWDAGSEFNSESCAFIPGPPCGSAGVHDPSPAEGFVHISSGIHGQGDLEPASHDWRNPVVWVTIRKSP